MTPLNLFPLGPLNLNKRPNIPSFLSAASGVVWIDGKLYTVGDDQYTVAVHSLEAWEIQTALRGEPVGDILTGEGVRLVPGTIESGRVDVSLKPDFEAMTIITVKMLTALPPGPIRRRALRHFPHGLLMVAGSGGYRVDSGERRRSMAVIYSLDADGHLIGSPSVMSMLPLHKMIEDRGLGGELNIEGICVHREDLVLAQRGNSLDSYGQPAQNLLIRISLSDVMNSLLGDLLIQAQEVKSVQPFTLGQLPVTVGGQEYEVKLDFTDIDAVEGDPMQRLVFTAAAEGIDGSATEGVIAGSVVGTIHEGKVIEMSLVPERIKLEGVNAHYNATLDAIDLLLVTDADDPVEPAQVYAARI
jgi:hypothetical protein